MRASAIRTALAATIVLSLSGLAGPGASADRRPSVARPPKGGSRVGISKHVIKIGMHAPLTGVAPVPSDAMEKAKDLFFRWIRARGNLIHHRRVRVILRNDNADPSSAVAACKELVEEKHVFALVGFVGLDQIRACARYAASRNVPYFAPGAMEAGMDLGQTFATSMTWPDQGPLMADYLVTDAKARRKKNAVVWMDTDAYREAKKPFVRSMHRKNARVYSRSVQEDANTTDATAVVQDLNERNIKNVYVLVTSTFWLQMIRAASQQNYHPLWTGIDPAFSSSTVGSTSCGFNNGGDGARAFSPYPAFIDRSRFDKKFDKAMAKFYPGEDGSDLLWGNWAQQKALAKLLRLSTRNLTRKRLVWFSEHSKTITTGVGSRLHFKPKNHFGADQVHLLKLDCSDRKWHTIRSFVSDF
jgi:branched-chain amino acid transport system substrate-binding protein